MFNRSIYAIIAFIIMILMLACSVFAEIPRLINYQGRATDTSDNPVSDGDYPVVFYLYDAPTSGTMLWIEPATVTTRGGLFTHLLGSVNKLSGDIFTQHDSLYLAMAFNGTTIAERTPITSVGYALRVNTVDGATGGTISGVSDTGVTIDGSPEGHAAVFAGLQPSSYSYTDSLCAVRGAVYGIGDEGYLRGGHFSAVSSSADWVEGVRGVARNNSATKSAMGVFGTASGSGTGNYGGYFVTDSGIGTGVYGAAHGNSGAYDIKGVAGSAYGWSAYTGISYAGYFDNSSVTGNNSYGVYARVHGFNTNSSSFGFYGKSENPGTGSSYGAYFWADSTGTGTSYGARGIGFSRGSTTAMGITGIAANRSTGDVYGGYFSAYNYGTGVKYGVFGVAPTSNGWAGYFSGDVGVSGSLTKGGGAFRIDHPLDPENKYLQHSFVESPDMMNIYNGNVTLDADGEAVVQLPEWFTALNRDFRYQLTPIGAPNPNLYIAGEVQDNQFRIAGGQPLSKVSWQVTGIRHDRYAEANRIEVEVTKRPQDIGKYLHPEAFGLGIERSIFYEQEKAATEAITQEQ